jgi:hypothetical protein
MNQDEFVAELGKLRSGNTFLTLHRYCNAHGEISDFSIAFHVSYESALKTSIKQLDAMKLKTPLDIQAREELLASFEGSLEKLQITPMEELEDAYEHLAKGCKLHRDNGELHLYGLQVWKRVLQAGVYPKQNKRALTIAKDKLRAQTRCGKWRQFKIVPGQVEHIAVEGCKFDAPSSIDELIDYLVMLRGVEA